MNACQSKKGVCRIEGGIFMVWVFFAGGMGCGCPFVIGRGEFFNSSLLSAVFVASVCFLPSSYYSVEC